MSRYIGPACRLCKAEGTKLFLKGDRCYTAKCAITKKEGATTRGKRGRPRTKISEYGIRLREKQKLRRFYGMTELQFKRFFEIANKQTGQTGHNFLSLLERRLDNVVYRLGFADSRAQARQLVTHGHFSLNGRKHNVPSALVSAGDVIAVRENKRGNGQFQGLQEVLERQDVVPWLRLDAAAMQGTVLAEPTRDMIDTPVQEQLIVEYYSR